MWPPDVEGPLRIYHPTSASLIAVGLARGAPGPGGHAFACSKGNGALLAYYFGKAAARCACATAPMKASAPASAPAGWRAGANGFSNGRRLAVPRAWTNKDERKFDHIKQSELEAGRSPAKAAEIAGRTVNKARREEGRTPNRRSQGTGNPNLPLEELTRAELYNRARARDIPGRSQMTKRELVETLRR